MLTTSYYVYKGYYRLLGLSSQCNSRVHSISNMTPTMTTLYASYAEITGILSDYFDGLYHSDTSKLSKVFHRMAHYACVTDGVFQRLTMDEYFPMVDRRASPASRSELRNDRIVSIEFGGPVTAFARAECSIGPKFFTDFLTFVFVDGRWQIISKVFHYDIRE